MDDFLLEVFKLGDALTEQLLEVVTLGGSQIVVDTTLQRRELARPRSKALDLADQLVGRAAGGGASTLLDNP
jgi:hypothetical protein